MKKRVSGVTRRSVLTGSLGTMTLVSAARVGLPLVAPFVLGRANAQSSAIPARGTHVLLLGTQGGPNFNANRGECASALIVDGKTYLVDCGYGAMMSLKKSGLNFRDVANVFLTHLHDDHVGDVAAFLSHQWTDGRIDPTLVVGTYGTEALVDAALAFAQANTDIRLIDEARSVKPADIFSGRDIDAPSEPMEIYADDRVRVSAVENTHFPDEAKERMPYRAVSYRFDTDDRSVVFSGDTAYSENLIELAKGADVFVCETIEVATWRGVFDERVAGGAYADNPEGIWDHIVGTHTSTEDAGRMAAAAGVTTLVLTHIIPGGLLEVGDGVYTEGVRRHFDGDVIVGRDLLVI
jgi:ribonuclease BN (tRNA processing enzyme)